MGEGIVSLHDGEEQDGDVVAAALVVGGLDESSAGGIELGPGGGMGGEFAPEDGGEGRVVELAGEAVGAEEVDVAGLRAVAVDVSLETRVRADGAGDEVAHGRGGGLVGGDLAGFHLLLDEGVVMRKLLEVALAQAVAAAVADVGKEEIGRGGEAGAAGVGESVGRWRDVEESDEGGAHAGLPRDRRGVLMDDGVGGEDGGLEAGLGPGVAGDRIAEVREEGGGGEVAGDFAGGGSAHSVAHDKGAEIGGYDAGVFVMAAGATDIGQHGVDEVVSWHGCEDKSGGTVHGPGWMAKARLGDDR